MLDKEPFRLPARVPVGWCPPEQSQTLPHLLPNRGVSPVARVPGFQKWGHRGGRGFGPQLAASQAVISFCSSLSSPVWDSAF